jgi:DNA polymerase III alpha subunit
MHINDQANEMMMEAHKDGGQSHHCRNNFGKKNEITKNSKMMAFLQLEDLVGTVEIIVFPISMMRNSFFNKGRCSDSSIGQH